MPDTASHRPPRGLRWIAGLCVLLALGGCVQIKEQVSGAFDPARVVATRTPVEHDIGVAAIELGSSATAMADGDISLMVVIGNSGVHPEEEIPVHVLLTDTDNQVVFDVTEFCRHIEPGDTAIVSFRGQVSQTTLPRYQLRVEVGSVAGESNTENNVRVYDVSVSQR